MASTTFVDNTTPIVASWLNDINNLAYTVFSGGTNTFLQVLKGPDGTAAAPTYSFANETGTGFYRDTINQENWVTNSINYLRLSGGGGLEGIRLGSTSGLHWTDTASISSSTTNDLHILRDAANTLAQRNGTNNQTLRIYKTFTDVNNYERFSIDSGTHVPGSFTLETEAAGTGTLRDIYFNAQRLIFQSAGTNRWMIDATGIINAMSDNSYDIGASGANRPRTIYAGTSMVVPTPAVGDNSTNVATTAYVLAAGVTISGMIIDYAGTSIPTGWLLCDGSAVSRTTYANLFAALGTTWGAGDGSTTFNVPNLLGKVTIGDGTNVTSETQTTSVASNAQIVSSNTAKWITGMCVRVSSSGSLPTGLSINTDYFIIRVDATHVSFATTLLNAQTGTVITISGGTGNITITTSGATAQSFNTHSVGEMGGEEKHAQAVGEESPHTHIQNAHSHGLPVKNSTNSAGSSILQGDSQVTRNATENTDSTTATNQTAPGGTSANIMQTYAVVKKIIKI